MVKVTTHATAPADPRVASAQLPIGIDADGLARTIGAAPTPQEAWRLLGLPGERPAALEARLVAAVAVAVAAGDAIGQGLLHFGTFAPDEDAPEAWVDRMVELHAAELDAWHAIDDLAWETYAADAGWVVSVGGRPNPATTEVARIAHRARERADLLRPPAGVLALDRLRHRLDAAVASGVTDDVIAAGRALVEGIARWRFTSWRRTRNNTEVSR